MRIKTNYFVSIMGLVLLILSVKSTAQDLPQGYPDSDRQKLRINNDWRFFLDKDQSAQISHKVTGDDWKQVSIPHGLALSDLNLNGSEDDATQQTFMRHVGWYSRTLDVKNVGEKQVYLEFEGVHQVTNLWVNGKHVGEHNIGGYTPFHFEITQYLNPSGENEILVSADNRVNKNIPPDGDQMDYIKWGGLYRDVYLVIKNPIHITFPWEDIDAGVHITTPTVTAEDATISIKASIANNRDQNTEVEVISKVIDQEGYVILNLTTSKTISAGQTSTLRLTGGITEDLHLWSCDNPYLYRVNTQVLANNKVVDCVEHPLGIRKIEFLKDQGFLLNGKNIELIGANRHQAYPFIGDAVPNSLHWKDAYQFKQAGFNVVRIAHYPHDNSFLDACDQLGILVYEEPPTWIDMDPGPWMDNLERATRVMIRNHRNHPSVIIWGAAINHRGPVERLHYASKEEDPHTATASNGSPWTGPRYSGVTDIYAPMDYQNMPVLDDDISFLCEHGSSDNADRNQYEVSRSKQSKNRIGCAVWTAHDYQSFKPRRVTYPRRVWSWHRVPNQPYFWYQSELRNDPIIHINTSTQVPEGKVLIYSNADKVALYHNGQLIGTQVPDHNHDRLYLDHPAFTFDYNWREGTIKAIGLYHNHELISTEATVAGDAHKLVLQYEDDNSSFLANGSDIKLIRAFYVDQNDHFIKNTDVPVHFKISGNGSLVGSELKDANPNTPLYGIATAYVKSSTQSGEIVITATGDGFSSAPLTIKTSKDTDNIIVSKAKPIYETYNTKVDLGGADQYIQFDWTSWTGTVVGENKIEILQDLKSQASISTSGDSISWTTKWGQSGPKAYLAMEGASSQIGESLSLTFSDLPKGQYKVVTYHHYSNDAPKIKGELMIKIDNGSEHIIKPTQGHYMNHIHPKSQEFIINSDGRTSKNITFKNLNNEESTVLNGFEIKKIK